MAEAVTLTVSTTTDEVNADGDCSLREAVAAANTDLAVDGCAAGTGADVISVPAGTFTLTLAGGGENAAATGDLDLTDADGVAVRGAGSASTIIDGDRIDRVFEARPGTATSRISDLTVREGASVVAPTGGGGIRAAGSNTSLVVDGAIVTENAAVQGGGIDAEAGAGLTVTDSAVTDNTTTRLSGGGIFFADGTASIDNTTIRANTAQAIVSGTANPYGGGISLLGATTTITGSTISANRAAGSGPVDAGPGGAGGGGISNAEGSSLEITNSTINANVLTGIGDSGGGGVDNGAFAGTVAAPTPSTAVLRHVTLAENSAPIGANLRSKAGIGTNALTTRAVIASDPVGGTNCDGTNTSQGFNLEFPGSSCGFELSADPKLFPLADNGGPTETRALAPASAAIDAVKTGCPPPNVDQRGEPRPLNGDGIDAALCDIGAFEQAARAAPPGGGSPRPPPIAPPPASGCPSGTSAGVSCEKSGNGLVITGTAGKDRITGTTGRDKILCGAGDDVVNAGPGDDVVNCGNGDDTVNGQGGNDRVSGQGDDDKVTGGSGKDRLSGGSGKDRLSGNSGNDRLAGGSGNDRASGGSGKDKISGNGGNDRLAGNSGNDRLLGGRGNDRLVGGPGVDVLKGGSGDNTLIQ